VGTSNTMSRLPTSSSRYKISNPRPVLQTNLNPYDDDNDDTHGGHQPQQSQSQSFSPIQHRQQSSDSYLRQNGESSRSATPTQDQGNSALSPIRPQRSHLRNVPGAAPNGSPQRPTRQELRPINTFQTDSRRPSAGSSMSHHDMLSPISPDGPPTQHQQGGSVSDPFEADRSQRTELRVQASAAAQQAAMPWHSPPNGGDQTSDRLRNVIGAFMAAGKRDKEDAKRLPPRSVRRPRRDQTGDKWDIPVDGLGRFAEVDSVLRQIKKDWPFVMESDFSPSTLALSLLSQTPSSSLPQHPSLSSFLKLHDALSSSLQASVQAHFQSFAASLPTHAGFLATLSRAQEQVRASQSALKEARDGFAGKGKAELAGVRARERQVREMLDLLDVM
jgi:exocyst complex component 4